MPFKHVLEDEPALTMPDEIDLSGRTDAEHEGIQYLGTAKRQANGRYHVLANVNGMLCTVEISIRPAGVPEVPECC